MSPTLEPLPTWEGKIVVLTSAFTAEACKTKKAKGHLDLGWQSN